jgi:hypothetical protein
MAAFLLLAATVAVLNVHPNPKVRSFVRRNVLAHLGLA